MYAVEVDTGAADPKNFSNLSALRKKELRRELHAFLKKVENRYGKMTDIVFTSCGTTPDLCKQHELKQSYLTMTTAKGATLVLGLKYVNEKWRRYTVDFKKPASETVKPVEEEPTGEEESDEAAE